MTQTWRLGEATSWVSRRPPRPLGLSRTPRRSIPGRPTSAELFCHLTDRRVAAGASREGSGEGGDEASPQGGDRVRNIPFGSGAGASNTRRSTSTPMPASPRPRPAPVKARCEPIRAPIVRRSFATPLPVGSGQASRQCLAGAPRRYRRGAPRRARDGTARRAACRLLMHQDRPSGTARLKVLDLHLQRPSSTAH